MTDNGTIIVEMTQYMRPDGRRNPLTGPIDYKFREAYEEMRYAGYNLACEELMTGQISVTIENNERDADIRIVKNGPDVVKAIGEMLIAKKWMVTGDRN